MQSLHPAKYPASSIDLLFVLVMRTNPKPFDGAIRINGRQGTVIGTHSRRPEIADFLEHNRRMPRITQPQSVIFPRELLNLGRQPGIQATEAWGRRGIHRVESAVDLLHSQSGASTSLQDARFGRLPLSAGPRRQLRARSSAPTASETPYPEVSKSRLRSLQRCSRRTPWTIFAVNSRRHGHRGFESHPHCGFNVCWNRCREKQEGHL